MKIKEKIIRKVNAYVQESNMSEEAKLFSENAILTIDICKKLSEIVTDNNTSYAQQKQLNEKMRRLMKELDE